MTQGQQSLYQKYFLLTALFFLILISRIAYLQIISWDKYYGQSERNRVRDVILDPPRGVILDRDGEFLVDNRPMYSVSVVPYEFLKSDSTITLLAKILQIPSVELISWVKERQIGNFNPVRIKRQIDFEAVSALEERKLELNGVFWGTESKRFYPGGVKAPHIFGYLGEITSDELISLKSASYKMGDLVGKNGLEKFYEDKLRGKGGIKYLEVDVLGREVRQLTEKAGVSPEPGENLYMTVDADIQRFLEKRMSDMRGAAIFLDPRNGDVLAIVSKPDYDPEIFSSPLTPNRWRALLDHEERPLYNRACQSLYPPGSTYKLVTVAAGLETGLIDTAEVINCPGYYRLGRRNFGCWKTGGHGQVKLLQAIQQSCNVYFYRKILDIGLDKWHEYSKRFRFGMKTSIDLPNESRGLAPDRVYFDTKYAASGWTKGLLLNLTVGQGDLLVTPLQMAHFAMIIGNEGVAFRPRLIRKIENPINNAISSSVNKEIGINGISSETYAIIKQGMDMVVNSQRGTAKAARVAGFDVCGKTGTAQNSQGESHAWFIGFAPRKDPEIAFCVMVENGGGGGAVAAPIAGEVLRIYFSEKKVAIN